MEDEHFAPFVGFGGAAAELANLEDELFASFCCAAKAAFACLLASATAFFVVCPFFGAILLQKSSADSRIATRLVPKLLRYIRSVPFLRTAF